MQPDELEFRVGQDVGRQRATGVVGCIDDDSLSPVGADVVCDASGSSRTLAAALRLVRPDGQVTKVGWSPEPLGVDLNPLVQKNVRLQGSFSHNWPIWERVLHLLASGLTGAEHIVGLRAGLPEWREAFDAMHEGRVIKSVLVPHADPH